MFGTCRGGGGNNEIGRRRYNRNTHQLLVLGIGLALVSGSSDVFLRRCGEDYCPEYLPYQRDPTFINPNLKALSFLNDTHPYFTLYDGKDRQATSLTSVGKFVSERIRTGYETINDPPLNFEGWDWNYLNFLEERKKKNGSTEGDEDVSGEVKGQSVTEMSQTVDHYWDILINGGWVDDRFERKAQTDDITGQVYRSSNLYEVSPDVLGKPYGLDSLSYDPAATSDYLKVKHEPYEEDIRNFPEEFDYVIVGSGGGGSPLARTLANGGFSVLVIERGVSRDEAVLTQDIYGSGLVIGDSRVSQRIVTPSGVMTHVGNVMGGGVTTGMAIVIQEDKEWLDALAKLSKLPFDWDTYQLSSMWTAYRVGTPMKLTKPKDVNRATSAPTTTERSEDMNSLPRLREMARMNTRSSIHRGRNRPLSHSLVDTIYAPYIDDFVNEDVNVIDPNDVDYGLLTKFVGIDTNEKERFRRILRRTGDYPKKPIDGESQEKEDDDHPSSSDGDVPFPDSSRSMRRTQVPLYDDKIVWESESAPLVDDYPSDYPKFPDVRRHPDGTRIAYWEAYVEGLYRNGFTKRYGSRLKIAKDGSWNAYSVFDANDGYFRRSADFFLGSKEHPQPPNLHIVKRLNVDRVEFEWDEESDGSFVPRATCAIARPTEEFDYATKGSPERAGLVFAWRRQVLQPDATGSYILSPRGRKLTRFCARKEVIISAGAVFTPTILARSGIGNAEQLDEIGITNPVLVNEAIGRNLMDRGLMPVAYFRDEPAQLGDELEPQVCGIVALAPFQKDPVEGEPPVPVKLGARGRDSMICAEEISGGRILEGFVYATRIIVPPHIRSSWMLDWYFRLLNFCSEGGESTNLLCQLTPKLPSCLRRLTATWYFVSEPKSRGYVTLHRDNDLTVQPNYYRNKQDLNDGMNGLKNLIRLEKSFRGVFESRSDPDACSFLVEDAMRLISDGAAHYSKLEKERTKEIRNNNANLNGDSSLQGASVDVRNVLKNAQSSLYPFSGAGLTPNSTSSSPPNMQDNEKLLSLFQMFDTSQINNGDVMSQFGEDGDISDDDDSHSRDRMKGQGGGVLLDREELLSQIDTIFKSISETPEDLAPVDKDTLAMKALVDVYSKRFETSTLSHIDVDVDEEVSIDGQQVGDYDKMVDKIYLPDHQPGVGLHDNLETLRFEPKSVSPDRVSGVPTILPDIDDEEALLNFMSVGIQSMWHLGGTAQFGSVVDRLFKVIGVRNLGVVDASNLNIMTRMNPTQTLLAMSRYAGVLRLLDEGVTVDWD